MVRRNTKGTGETQADVEREQVKVDPKEDLASGANKRAFASDHLLSFVERVERLNEEITTLGEDRTEVFSEAKSMGFDAKVLRQVIARRKLHADDRAEGDAIRDLYEDSIKEAEGRRLKKSVDEGK